ncbi:hypothetical protein [Rothia sp. (in: high G+C Gram-positive bacteria)]|uniref:hypothetical protein n=1 Tax=Rothia sp. (in: high G+C Gram-positive bacteria) TaxID=1885016 RepID=UPI0032167BC4
MFYPVGELDLFEVVGDHEGCGLELGGDVGQELDDGSAALAVAADQARSGAALDVVVMDIQMKPMGGRHRGDPGF